MVDVLLVRLGEEVRSFSATVDIDQPEQLTKLLASAARRHGGADVEVSEYEIEVRSGGGELLRRFVMA